MIINISTLEDARINALLMMLKLDAKQLKVDTRDFQLTSMLPPIYAVNGKTYAVVTEGERDQWLEREVTSEATAHVDFTRSANRALFLSCNNVEWIASYGGIKFYLYEIEID